MGRRPLVQRGRLFVGLLLLLLRRQLPRSFVALPSSANHSSQRMPETPSSHCAKIAAFPDVLHH